MREGRYDAPVAICMSVVPVSTIPAVSDRMFVLVPYRICWLIPQNLLEGLVVVIGLPRCSSQRVFLRV